MSSVLDSKLIDLIGINPESGKCTLVMIEEREWDSSPGILLDIQNKVNNYLIFVLDGQMLDLYPESKGISVIFQLYCNSAPSGKNAKFINLLTTMLQEYNILFQIKVDIEQTTEAC